MLLSSAAVSCGGIKILFVYICQSRREICLPLCDVLLQSAQMTMRSESLVKLHLSRCSNNSAAFFACVGRNQGKVSKHRAWVHHINTDGVHSGLQSEMDGFKSWHPQRSLFVLHYGELSGHSDKCEIYIFHYTTLKQQDTFDKQLWTEW